jgi:hypothetical protein
MIGESIKLPKSPRELVVITRPDAKLRISGNRAKSLKKSIQVSPLNDLLATEGINMNPLFGLDEDRIQAITSSLEEKTNKPVHDLSNYYHVVASDDRLDALAEQFRKLDVVEAAYVKPSGEPPLWRDSGDIVLIEVKADKSPAATPNFTPRQGYLNIAPEGIDAYYAWNLNGGRGSGVKIIDCEWSWNLSHEDLQNLLGILVGVANGEDNNHGTAVLGEIGGNLNSFGVTGISTDAQIGCASFSNNPSAQVIREAADKLNPGDIILLEIHRPGPNATGVQQFGYIAIEWWPDDFAAIRYAIIKGIVVVEAAGNGSQNLDDPIYNVRPTGFPSSWTNPFNLSNPSSEAVIVGAGAPPQGTHGRDWGPDRSRLDFSNYGSRVDCQGWGREVTTTGYGDLQNGSDSNLWYTDTFAGTSSASPIVVGAVACAQGVLKAMGGALLDSNEARNILRSTGSPQQDAIGRPASQRIGNRPNLRQLIVQVPPPPPPPPPQNPWDTPQGQACFERWISEAMSRLNAYKGSSEFNARKPWSINKYGVLEGRPPFGPHSVYAPDDFRFHNNNKYWWMWDNYPPSYCSDWQNSDWKGAKVPFLRDFVRRCLSQRTK